MEEFAEFSFRMAEPADFNQIVDVINDGKISIGKLGIDQWQNNYPPVETIKNDIESGCAVLLTNGDEVVCTATVIFTGEPTYKSIFDGSWLTSVEDYAVIHRMSVKESYKRKGVALLMMQHILNICKEKNVLSVRIDTHRGNIPMRKMIEKCGYEYCGVIFLADGAERLAFELVL